MEYILTQAEYDELTPVKRLQERNEALEVAREIILSVSGFKCGDYCDDCPINYMYNDNPKVTRDVTNHICIRGKNYHR